MKRNVETGFLVTKMLTNLTSAWFFATYTVFLEAKGLDKLSINLVNTVYMTLATVLDPFTGYLADRIGQKVTYFCGMFFWGIGSLVYGFSQNFAGFATAEIMAAIGHALMSEALESWLHNHVGEKSQETMSKTGQWMSLARIPTAIAGSMIGARYGLEWPWFLAGGSCFLAMIFSWWWIREIPEKPAGYVQQPMPKLASILRQVWQNRTLRTLVVIYMLVGICCQPLNMYWALVLKEATKRTDWLGSVWIVISVASASGARLAKSWPLSRRALAGAMVIIGLPMIFPFLFPRSVAGILTCMLVHEVGRGLWPIAFFAVFNDKFKDKQIRATVNSIKSSMWTLGGAIGLPIFGVIANQFSMTISWLAAGIALLIVSLICWVIKEKE